jgi:hypothetical protein
MSNSKELDRYAGMRTRERKREEAARALADWAQSRRGSTMGIISRGKSAAVAL